MKDLDFRVSVVKEKIEQATEIIDRRTKPVNPFGSPFGTRNGLKYNPPIQLEKLVEIESQYEIKFPDEYRAFITKIADGGSGPDYGLFALEHSLKCSVYVDQKNQIDYSFLKTPFIHTSRFNPQEDHPYIKELCRRDDADEISYEEFELAFSPVYDRLTAGTMIISHSGCGYYERLVVTGATRGQIWGDGECTDQGYIPRNLGFLDWYEEWLDKILINTIE